jgi:hypothetical protein
MYLGCPFDICLLRVFAVRQTGVKRTSEYISVHQRTIRAHHRTASAQQKHTSAPAKTGKNDVFSRKIQFNHGLTRIFIARPTAATKFYQTRINTD